MSEAIAIVMISTMGGTLLTVIGSIVQQGMSVREARYNAEKLLNNNNVGRIESRDSFDSLKDILNDQQDILKNQQNINRLILRDRLRCLLKQYQDVDSVAYADKEDIDAMYEIYCGWGFNGTIKAMYENFLTKKII